MIASAKPKKSKTVRKVKALRDWSFKLVERAIVKQDLDSNKLPDNYPHMLSQNQTTQNTI